MFSVHLSNAAKKGLSRCQKDYAETVKEALLALKQYPYPFQFYDLKKICGCDNSYRIRIGKWRIKYEVLSEDNLIVIISIERKSDTTYKHR